MTLASSITEAMMRRACWLLLGIGILTACAAKIDLATAVQIEGFASGWIDAGVVDGKHKIVPVATFMLKNVSDRTLAQLQVNAVFRQMGDSREWSSAYVPDAASELAPGAATGPLTVMGQNGYTSEDPAEMILSNPKFVDVTLELLVRSRSSAWTKLGEYVIDRKLIVP